MARKQPGTHSDLIRCTSCGEDYASSYKRCPFCGDKLTHSTSQSAPAAEDEFVFEGGYIFDEIDAETIKAAREIFDRYRDNGVITGGRFEDDEWPVTDEKSRTSIRFGFSEIEYDNHAKSWVGCTAGCFRDAVKSCVLFHMGAWTLATLRQFAFHLCGIAGADFPDEDGFGEESSQVLEILQMIPGYSEMRNAAIECLEDCASLYRIRSGGQRKLLDFAAYFRFHDALDTYWKSATEEDRVFYFPLYLLATPLQ